MACDFHQDGQDGDECSLDVEPDQGQAWLITWISFFTIRKRPAATPFHNLCNSPLLVSPFKLD